VNPSSLQFIDTTFWTAEVYGRWVDVDSSWTSYSPTWTGSSINPNIQNGSLTGAWKQWDGAKMAQVRILMVAGSNTTFGSGQWSFSLPSGLSPVTVNAVIHGHLLDTSASSNRYACVGMLNSSPSAVVSQIAVNGTAGVSSTIPFTWGDSDALVLGGTFEIS
jgi:hypothetical protein